MFSLSHLNTFKKKLFYINLDLKYNILKLIRKLKVEITKGHMRRFSSESAYLTAFYLD